MIQPAESPGSGFYVRIRLMREVAYTFVGRTTTTVTAPPT